MTPHPALSRRPRELVQLAGTWDFRSVPEGGCIAEQKIDGWRAVCVYDRHGRPALLTRNGNIIEGAAHILHRLALIERAYGCPVVFDGEFQVGGTLSATKVWCESGWKSGREAGTLYLFDAMPMEAWEQGGDDAPLYQRKARLKMAMEAANSAPEAWDWRAGSHGRDDPHCVRLLPDEWVSNKDDALDFARRIWAGGGEGAILKDAEAPYRRNRTGDWRKVKSPAYVAR